MKYPNLKFLHLSADRLIPHLAILLLCLGGAPAAHSSEPAKDPGPPLTPEAAAKAVDSEVLVEGVVTELVKTDGGTVYLNFGGKFPDEILTVVVLPSLVERFPNLDKLAGQKVRAKGKVTLKNGKHPRILVRETTDLVVVPVLEEKGGVGATP